MTQSNKRLCRITSAGFMSRYTAKSSHNAAGAGLSGRLALPTRRCGEVHATTLHSGYAAGTSDLQSASWEQLVSIDPFQTAMTYGADHRQLAMRWQTKRYDV